MYRFMGILFMTLLISVVSGLVLLGLTGVVTGLWKENDDGLVFPFLISFTLLFSSVLGVFSGVISATLLASAQKHGPVARRLPYLMGLGSGGLAVATTFFILFHL